MGAGLSAGDSGTMHASAARPAVPATARWNRFPMNAQVAERLEEAGRLLEARRTRKTEDFRAQAYRNAATTIRDLPRDVAALLHEEGLDGLDRLPGIGRALARSISLIVTTGRLPLLDRLRAEQDPVAVLQSVPGIGKKLAERLHDDLGIGTLTDLETAAYDGRLASFPGFGDKRIASIRDALATRLARRQAVTRVDDDAPSVDEILDVDREYREASAAGRLHRIAPIRFNRERKAWLPVMHSWRGSRHYTALFSNTARAHQLGKTHDWVVIYLDAAGRERQYTVVTASSGPLKGLRTVRGREVECERYYGMQ